MDADVVALLSAVSVMLLLVAIYGVAVHGVPQHRTAGFLAIMFLSLLAAGCAAVLINAVSIIVAGPP